MFLLEQLISWSNLTWMAYNIVIPLAPVALVYLAFRLLDSPRKLRTIVRDGQLCFFCTSLAAVAINDVSKLPNIHQNAPAKLAIAGFLICILHSTFIYGIATYGISRPSTIVGDTGLSGDAADLDTTSYERKLFTMSLMAVIMTTCVVVFSRILLGVPE